MCLIYSIIFSLQMRIQSWASAFVGTQKNLFIKIFQIYFDVFSAMVVRYVTKRFIGDYDPSLGKHILCKRNRLKVIYLSLHHLSEMCKTIFPLPLILSYLLFEKSRLPYILY